MHIPKKYFQDRTVLLLLSVNFFMALLAVITTLLRLDVDTPNGYSIEYRSQLGLGAYTRGDSTTFLFFIVFCLLALGFHIFLSLKVYDARRSFAIIVLALGLALLTTVVRVSDALLSIRL